MWGVVLTVVFSTAAAVALLTAVVAYRARTVVPAGTPLFLAAIGITCWSVTAAVTADRTDPDLITTLASIGVFGQCLIVLGYLGLAEVVSGRPWRPGRRALVLLGIEPALVVTALITEPWHHLFFDGITRTPVGTWQAGIGVGYTLHIVYSYAIVLFGAYRGLRLARRRSTFSRRAGRWLIAIVAPPVVANVVAMTMLDNIDVTLIGTTISTVLAYGALTWRSLELLPVARAQLVDTLADGVVVVDRNGNVADLNAVGRQMVLETAPWITDPIGVELDSIDPTFPALAESDADFIFVSARLGLDLEIRTRVIRDRHGALAGWVLIARDVTEFREQRRALEAANQQLREQITTIDRLRADLAEQAIRDALTGLHNRRHLMNVLAAAERDHTGPISVALIDVDHFKQVNDRYGHAAGDRVLVAVARLLAAGVRPTDVLARYGGEEFVLLMPGCTVDDAADRLEQLRKQVAATPIELAGRTVTVSFSAGVASGWGRLNTDAMLEAADHALYAAKRNGRDRVELATPVR
ncbi:histidine kinase N-terminal 7TM domain-containing diguanylate cyclase [Cryptosporangium aurantiacum]|uniref:Diguanylate cyclase (GGDEF) domain-containing protein n=1 Tax=Cryptosporangium aurantiacum TaxID=134849 RepID=A0A1M7RIU1_9ACTN|nr:diguanylate cyclase [Cryptosporangium aurantiacum]SHN46223.1 diguanylate cyclase (GGDEF) domain-containing protein [Cryptosporangium aurantiacum]